MCGIAGFVTNRPVREAASTLQRMTAAIRHRGPDDCGSYCDGRVGWGTAASASSISPRASQPMANEDGSLWIIYNGEIFNHADLRPDLERAGHRYSTRSDTETILHAYEEYGAGLPDPLSRHVRVRHLGPATRDAVLRPRPAGHQAVLLLLGRPAVRVRLGDQGAAGASRRSRPRFDESLLPEYLLSATPAGSARCFAASAS